MRWISVSVGGSFSTIALVIRDEPMRRLWTCSPFPGAQVATSVEPPPMSTTTIGPSGTRPRVAPTNVSVASSSSDRSICLRSTCKAPGLQERGTVSNRDFADGDADTNAKLSRPQGQRAGVVLFVASPAK